MVYKKQSYQYLNGWKQNLVSFGSILIKVIIDVTLIGSFAKFQYIDTVHPYGAFRSWTEKGNLMLKYRLRF